MTNLWEVLRKRLSHLLGFSNYCLNNGVTVSSPSSSSALTCTCASSSLEKKQEVHGKPVAGHQLHFYFSLLLFIPANQALLDELGQAMTYKQLDLDTKLAVWFLRNKLEKGLKAVLFIPVLVATWSNSDFRDSKNRKRWKKTNGPSSHINFYETESCQWYAARNGVQTPK